MAIGNPRTMVCSGEFRGSMAVSDPRLVGQVDAGVVRIEKERGTWNGALWVAGGDAYEGLNTFMNTTLVSEDHGMDMRWAIEGWVSDGTPSGTRMLADTRAGREGSSSLRSAPSVLREVDGLVYMATNDGVHGMELWVTDGSPSGTRMVRDINPDGASGPIGVATVGPVFYFTADDGRHGQELWRTDGTVDGTRMVRDINRRPR